MSFSIASLPHRFYRLLQIERRQQPRRAHPVTLAQSRIFILPSRNGWGFSVLIIAMLIAATNFANSSLFILTFLLTGILLVTMFHTYRNMSALTFHPGHGSHCFCGEQAPFALQIENPSANTRQGLDFELQDQTTECAGIHVEKGHTHLTISITSKQRGRLSMPVLLISSRYPFGLFRAWSRVRLDTECIVYPRPANDGPAPPRSHGHNDSEGISNSGQDDFIGYRNYQVTDSPRHVDWKAVARGRPMMTKLFSSAGDDEWLLDWNSLSAADDEQRLSQLSRWILMAEAGSRRYALQLPGQTLEASRGEAHKHRCLTALAVYGLDHE